MNYNKFRRVFVATAVVVAAGLMSFAGCTTSDDTLGQGFLPDNQEMITGAMRLDKAKRFFKTQLFQTDSIKASNIGYGYFGASRNDTTGLVASGFMSQYMSYYRVDSGYFGYRPIFDSAQIILTIKSFGADTLTPQIFNVYEITSSDYLSEKDTVFYLNFDPTQYVSTEPLFSFTFPNGTTTGPATKTVTMSPTAKGREFVNRLMISDGTKLIQEGVGYSVYKDNPAFVKAFKGIYIKPVNTDVIATGKGAVFGAELAASGFAIYCRNRVQSDPTLIKDTVGAVYYFYDSTVTDAGNESVNVIHHDYTGSQITIADAVETNPNRPENTGIIVSGMGGVISELSFTQEFFDAIEAEIKTANTTNGKGFETLGVNRALLTIYFTGSDYDWNKIDQAMITSLMPVALPRLGSYTNYKKLTGIVDYDYYTEQTYDYTLAYGGYINRSQGCYTLDISGYIQQLWNSYREAKKTAGERAVDLSKLKNPSIFLGPNAYNLYTSSFSKVQGMAGDGNNAPVKIDLTYTLIK